PRPISVAFLLEDLEGSIEIIPTNTAVHSSRSVQLRNCTPIASYSWIEGTPPVIAVPGYPRIWRNTTVKEVKPDSGVHYVDRNASHMARRSPLLPIFASIDTLRSNFRYNDLDLVTDRNNLRKLLRCIDAQRDREFRIDVDLVGKTCLLTRREETMMETINEFRGYGHEYEQASTRAHRGSEDEIGHHRIVTYEFGRLKVLLRCSVDACTESGNEDDDLLAFFSSLSIGRNDTKTSEDSTYTTRFGIKVKLTSPRSVVPQSSVIEIKTRASHRELDWKEAYPQLYLSQTPYLYLAKHSRGQFGPVEKVQLNSQAMASLTTEAEAAMGKLEVLLETLLKAVRKQGEGVPLSLVYREGKLRLYKRKRGTGKLIGEEIYSKFHPSSAI
ncbi:hypothetical protein ID866_11663, partial [Astraeus odoratus]